MSFSSDMRLIGRWFKGKMEELFFIKRWRFDETGYDRDKDPYAPKHYKEVRLDEKHRKKTGEDGGYVP